MYGRHLKELREIAEPILRETLRDDTVLRWMQGTGSQEPGTVEVGELKGEEVKEWTEGGRNRERVAGATRTRGMYLSTMATVANAEAVGVMLAWEECDRVALDSQGVIQRIWSLQYISPRSWTEAALRSQCRGDRGN